MITTSMERFPPPPPQLLEDDDTFPEPPPDYEQNAQEEQENPGLIPPHKIPNPVLESRDRVQLNKDIIFNAKQ
ncbi:hypothetical protein EB796_017218 [Bugula neritina]|uniref:Uncharacterized protein n=1 Tax=Bugula neritina TaxID=10212 RepID=A0A7J7JFS3_BUGNE|nr:hypothetical protein EB796_017218 [Bugula neritina]